MERLVAKPLSNWNATANGKAEIESGFAANTTCWRLGVIKSFRASASARNRARVP
jgi:hypothetical protein